MVAYDLDDMPEDEWQPKDIEKRPHLIDSIMTVTIMERWKVMNNKSKSAVRRFLKSVKRLIILIPNALPKV